MSIERFDRTQFEAALPKHKETGAPLWTEAGFQKGEYCYHVKPLQTRPYIILIRSSIDGTGISATTGEDSIRLYITLGDKPAGNKMQAWITRRPGWDERLTAMLRTLAGQIKNTRQCPHCQRWPKIFTVKKKGPNHGRPFMTCDCKVNGFFEFLDVEPKEVPTSTPAPTEPKKTITLAEAKRVQAWHARNPGDEDEILTDDNGRYHPQQRFPASRIAPKATTPVKPTLPPVDGAIWLETLQEAIADLEAGKTEKVLADLKFAISHFKI